VRERWLRGSDDVQTAHLHAIMGTPCDVPVPRKMISMVEETTDDTDHVEGKAKGISNFFFADNADARRCI